MRLTLDVRGQDSALRLPDDGAALVGLMSFAVSRGFGAQHPAIALADRLHQAFGVSMGPLTTFYDGNTEDSEDREKLEAAWQPAGPLRDSLERIAAALETDEQCQALARRAGMDGLANEIAALAAALREAESAGRDVRLGYLL